MVHITAFKWMESVCDANKREREWERATARVNMIKNDQIITLFTTTYCYKYVSIVWKIICNTKSSLRLVHVRCAWLIREQYPHTQSSHLLVTCVHLNSFLSRTKRIFTTICFLFLLFFLFSCVVIVVLLIFVWTKMCALTI